MIHSIRFKAILDTNVLYPIVIRDILFWLAHYDLYRPAWSNHIFEEWDKVIRVKNPNFSDVEVNKGLKIADEAFPFARVENYENLIDGLTLKDTNDRHVLAAAIKINANVIVTQNLKDFPVNYLAKFNIDSKIPDDFICDIIDLDIETAVAAFKEMVLNKRNPDLDEFQVLDQLRNAGLNESANYFHSQI